jgi:hypothetical protein
MQNELSPVNKRRHRFRDFIRRQWQPTKIEPPTVDPELEDLDPATRSAEVIRYSLLSLEWWISKNGTLREWLKLNGKISSLLLIPAVLVMPLVTFILWQCAKWMSWLVGIAGNLILFPVIGLVGIVIAFIVVAILRVIFGK